MPDSQPIERATPGDLVMLAMGRGGGTPEQLGAVLVLAPGTDVAALEHALATRARNVPRLRQRLVTLPPGCGRPVWVDDPDDDPALHVRRLRCAEPCDEQAVLDLAARIVTDPLPRSRPLWAAVVVTGLAAGRIAVIFVLHHVVADGIAGLAILGRLADGVPGRPAPAIARPRPTWALLAGDAFRSRLHGLRRLPVAVRALRTSFTAGGGFHPPPAAPCSLLRPTGRRRQFAVTRTDLAGLRATAHRYGGTVNDALLAAVAGALDSLLAARGEHIDEFRIGLMAAARSATSAEALGNTATPMLAGVPADPDTCRRLAAIAGTLRPAANGPPPLAFVSSLFRAAAALGLFRQYMVRQRRLHTLTSNVHGPDRPLTLAGNPIESIIPISAGEAGNVTVGFVALSYAGTLTITIATDPGTTPDLPTLAAALQKELDVLCAPTGDV